MMIIHNTLCAAPRRRAKGERERSWRSKTTLQLFCPPFVLNVDLIWVALFGVRLHCIGSLSWAHSHQKIPPKTAMQASTQTEMHLLEGLDTLWGVACGRSLQP